MRRAVVALAALVVACGPGDLPTDRISLLRDPCDVTLYIEQCREAGLPTDVGVAWGCHRMVVPRGVETPDLVRCETAGDFKCCETRAGRADRAVH